jgi:hypothetical protein
MLPSNRGCVRIEWAADNGVRNLVFVPSGA